MGGCGNLGARLASRRLAWRRGPREAIPVELRVTADAPRAIIEKYKEMVEARAKITATITPSGGPIPGAAKALIGADVQVLMPLCRKGIGAAAALMFVLLFHEFSASLMVRSARTQETDSAAILGGRSERAPPGGATDRECAARDLPHSGHPDPR